MWYLCVALSGFSRRGQPEFTYCLYPFIEDSALLEKIAMAAEMCIGAYSTGKKTIFAGNGGSAADAQHMAGEFVSKFYFDRPGLSSIALTTDTSILTAIGNDYGYEKICRFFHFWQ